MNRQLRCLVSMATALSIIMPLLAAFLLPGEGYCAALDELQFSSDIRLRWRWVDSAAPGPLRSTYGESIQRGVSLKHRFVFELAYPVAHDLRLGGLVRISNEPELVLVTGPDYYSSEFGSAFIAYETPTIRSRFGYYDTYYTPLTLMRWDLKDDAEGGGCAVCASTPGTAGAILGESLEILGPSLRFEGLTASAYLGDMLALDAFYARPRVSMQTDYGLMRRVNAYGAKLDLSRYVPSASELLKIGLMAVRTEEDEGSVESLDGPPVYPPEPFKYTVYGLSIAAPVLRWVTLSGEATLTQAHEFAIFEMIDKDGRGAIASLEMKRRGMAFDGAYIYLTPDWESYFRALSYSPDRKGPRLRFAVERDTWLVSVFMRFLMTVNRIAGDDTDRLAYPTWSVQGSFMPDPLLLLSASIVYTGSGFYKGGLDFEEDTRLYTYVLAAVIEIARGTKITIEDRYISNRDYEDGDFNYDANMISLYLKADIW
jgi:hypothetical protein